MTILNLNTNKEVVCATEVSAKATLMALLKEEEITSLNIAIFPDDYLREYGVYFFVGYDAWNKSITIRAIQGSLSSPIATLCWDTQSAASVANLIVAIVSAFAFV